LLSVTFGQCADKGISQAFDPISKSTSRRLITSLRLTTPMSLPSPITGSRRARCFIINGIAVFTLSLGALGAMDTIPRALHWRHAKRSLAIAVAKARAIIVQTNRHLDTPVF
jgi:hypothetical protein